MEDQTKVKETGNGVEERVDLYSDEIIKQVEAPEQSLASKMASENAIAQADEAEQAKLPEPIVLEITEDLDVTSLDAFLEGAKKSVEVGAVKTPGGFTFEIKALEPGELLLLAGSPLFAGLVDEVRTTGKRADVSETNMIKLISDPQMMAGIKTTVCFGITSIQFVNKSIARCDPDEVSIEKMPFIDLMVAFQAIGELSWGSGGESAFRYFQAENQSEQGSAGAMATPDGESV